MDGDEETVVNTASLHVISEDADSDANNGSSDCEAFSEPSSVSSLDSARLCMIPHQVQGIPQSAESQSTRVLGIPTKKGHQRSFSAVAPIQNLIQPHCTTEGRARRRRCYSESDQMEVEAIEDVEKLVRSNSATKVLTGRSEQMEDKENSVVTFMNQGSTQYQEPKPARQPRVRKTHHQRSSSMFVRPLSAIHPLNSGGAKPSGVKPSGVKPPDHPKRRRCSSLSEVLEMSHCSDDPTPVVAMETDPEASGSSDFVVAPRMSVAQGNGEMKLCIGVSSNLWLEIGLSLWGSKISETAKSYEEH